MDKKQLNKYRFLVKELEKLDKQISKQKVNMPTDNFSILLELQDKRDGLYNSIANQIKEIEEFIDDIQDSRIRQIFRYKYIDGLRWQDISKIMNYSDSHIRRLHSKVI